VSPPPPAGRASNLAVARLFEEIAQSLEVAGEQGHRLRAYRRAARGVAAEFLSTGGMRTHARLVDTNPPGLAPLLQARGFGPTSVQALHAALGATDLDAVERAASEGRLAEVLGPRRAEDLVAQLPALRNPIRALRLKHAWETAGLVVQLLRDPSVAPRQIEVAGAARRMCETVVGGLDIVAVPGPRSSRSVPTQLGWTWTVAGGGQRSPRLARAAGCPQHATAGRASGPAPEAQAGGLEVGRHVRGPIVVAGPRLVQGNATMLRSVRVVT